LALIFLLITSVVVAAFPVDANVSKLDVTIIASTKGRFGSLDIVQTVYPVTVSFSLQGNFTGESYLWKFGDGTNSTSVSPSHVYAEACLYNISVSVALSNRTVAKGAVEIGMFDGSGPSGSIDVCPPQGTAGFSPVELAGGFFQSNENVMVMMNNKRLVNVTTDDLGHFSLDLNSSLRPAINGTIYVFTTDPSSTSRTYTTLEGVRAEPSTGPPGTQVEVDGHSYLPDSTVMIYLGGVYITTAQTDDNGSFSTSAKVPRVLPITTPGSYDYSTSPPILGSEASFKTTAEPASILLSGLSWWWWIILLVVVILLALWYLRRRQIQRSQT